MGVNNYQVCIVGGGLAGLSLAIQLGRAGLSVALFDAGSYPRHKVCGEYLSNESKQYLLELCPALDRLKLPDIQQFELTSTQASKASFNLGLGGFGISRYLLEKMLKDEAELEGVDVFEQTKVTDVQKSGPEFTVTTTKGAFSAQLVVGSFGKKSVMEKVLGTGIAWQPNYVGVKYHIKTQHPNNLIAIHSFPGGYCGISNVENETSCLCYIVNARFLNESQNQIPELERRFLHQNPHLKTIFNKAEFLWDKPLAISNVHFGIQASEKEHVLLLGDAAGCIAPITGNGMSNALRSAWFANRLILPFFEGKISRNELEKKYAQFWSGQFSTRIKLSRTLQRLAEKPRLSGASIHLFNLVPGLGSAVVKLTHGQPF